MNKELNTKTKKCCFCGEEIVGSGHNPYPLKDGVEFRCCQECNDRLIVPARIYLSEKKNSTAEQEKEISDRKAAMKIEITVFDDRLAEMNINFLRDDNLFPVIIPGANIVAHDSFFTGEESLKNYADTFMKSFIESATALINQFYLQHRIAQAARKKSERALMFNNNTRHPLSKR